jgi:flagella basal body P-ring formation protein FlgA
LLIERHALKIILVLILIFGINALAAKAKVEVLPQVYVSNEHILLKDITKSENVSPELQTKINSIVIGDTPKEGEVRSFSSYAISEIIRYNLRSEIENLIIKIPSEVKVSRKATKLTPKEVQAKIETWVESTCAPCEVRIGSLRVQDAGKLTPAMTWSISNTQIIPRGNFNISLDIFKNNNFYKKVFVQGNLRILKEVPVVKRNLQYGERIQRDDVSFEKQDITFNRETIPAAEELYGSEIAGNLSSGQIIWQRNLKRKMALTRGTPVQVTVQNQGWRIHLTGISQDNGYLGDTVKVLNPETKKIIVGVVSGDSKVEVR